MGVEKFFCGGGNKRHINKKKKRISTHPRSTRRRGALYFKNGAVHLTRELCVRSPYRLSLSLPSFYFLVRLLLAAFVVCYCAKSPLKCLGRACTCASFFAGSFFLSLSFFAIWRAGGSRHRALIETREQLSLAIDI